MNSPSLLSDLGLGDLPSEDQALIAERITEAILKRVTAEFLNELSADDLEELEGFSLGATPDEIEDFFRSRFPDHDARIEKVVAEFKEEMGSHLAELENN